jgi:hypothetical protein
MNPRAKETSDGWVDCALTLVVSGIRLAAHSALAVDTVRETTDQLRTTTAALSARQRSTMDTSDK